MNTVELEPEKLSTDSSSSLCSDAAAENSTVETIDALELEAAGAASGEGVDGIMELGQGNTVEADAVACKGVPGRAGKTSSDRRTETTPPGVHPPTLGTLIGGPTICRERITGDESVSTWV